MNTKLLMQKIFIIKISGLLTAAGRGYQPSVCQNRPEAHNTAPPYPQSGRQISSGTGSREPAKVSFHYPLRSPHTMSHHFPNHLNVARPAQTLILIDRI